MAPKELVLQRELHVEAPPERIWPLVDDPEQLGRWWAFADRIEALEGDGVGRKQRLHGHWGTRHSEIDQEIVVYDPPKTLAWRHLDERLDGKPATRFSAETVATIALTPEGSGTRVRLESRQLPLTRVRGVIMRRVGQREVERRLEQSLADLRAAVAA